MIVKMVKSTYKGHPQLWASALVQQIKTGAYKSDAAEWISCSSTTEPLFRQTIQEDIQAILDSSQSPSFEVTPLVCPMVWARESNAYDCVCLQCSFFLKDR